MSRKFFVLSFIVLLLIHCNNDNKYKELGISDEQIKYIDSILYNKNIRKQETKSRSFVQYPDKIQSIKFRELYNPAFADVYKNYIFIIDYSSMFIHRISLKDTNDYLVFGNGKGRGPGELINPINFQLYKNKIFISDAAKHTIEIYSISGKYLKSIKLEECAPYRFIIDKKNEKLIINNQYDNVFLYYKFDFNGNFLKKFGAPLIMEKINSGLYHESFIHSLNENSFLQVPLRLGVVGCYRNDSLIFIKETIDGIQKNPKGIVTTETGEYVNKNDFLYTCLKISSNNNYVLMARLISKENIRTSCFDLYENKTLKYCYSFKLPIKIKNIFLHYNDKYFITYNDTNLIVWKLPNIINENK